MIQHSTQTDSGLDLFRSLLVVATLPIMASTCFVVRACSLTPDLTEVLLVSVLLLGQFFLITCLESRNVFLYSIMIAGLLAKVTAASLHVGMAHWGESDALIYYDEARNLAVISHRFADFFGSQQIWGTEFIVAVTACLNKVAGASFLAATVFFALVSYWGEYLYYLTYREMFPDADPRWAAACLFLWPSIVFWPAALGKDALMLFLLGLTAFSMAKLSKRKTPGMLVLLVIGALGSAMIRPHIATLLCISIAASYFLGGETIRRSNASRKVLGLAAMSVISLLVVYLCAQLLQVSDIAESQNRLELSVQLNQMDGSGFNPSSSLLSRVVLSPLLMVRPFPWEINSAQAGLAALEGMLLLGLAIGGGRRVLAQLKSERTDRFLMFASCFVALNVLLLGVASSNFGLLVRERVMIYPLLLILLLAFRPKGDQVLTENLVSAPL